MLRSVRLKDCNTLKTVSDFFCTKYFHNFYVLKIISLHSVILAIILIFTSLLVQFCCNKGLQSWLQGFLCRVENYLNTHVICSIDSDLLICFVRILKARNSSISRTNTQILLYAISFIELPLFLNSRDGLVSQCPHIDKHFHGHNISIYFI